MTKLEAIRARVRTTSLSLALVCACGLVRAADDDSGAGDHEPSPVVVQLNEEGTLLYKARSYRKAAEKFLQAYAMERDSNLLFNIARCYEKLGDMAAAREKYAEFLSAPGADAAGRQRAEEALRALDELERTRSQATTPPARDATLSEQSSQDRATRARAESARATPGLWPWLALGTGIASVAVGTVFYVLGVNDHRAVTSADGYAEPSRVLEMTEAEARALVDSGNTKKWIGGVGLGLGGALIATSFVVFVTDIDRGDERRAVAVDILPSSQGASLRLRGSF